MEQHVLEGKQCFFCCFFYPYKTTKRKKKKKRKAFNWYKNTYINQATFHYLFINHIHISKIEPLALPPSLRTKKNQAKIRLNNTVSPSSAHRNWPSFWMAQLIHYFFFFSDKRVSLEKQYEEVVEHAAPGFDLNDCLAPL